ncbi:MAG: ABC transporter permease subunit [Acidothermaceae bacterium]
MSLTVTMLDLRLRRRATIGYTLGLAAYAFAIVAMYPSFKTDTSLDKLAQSDPTLMAAFGVTGSLTSPTGWLNANVYNNFLPLVAVIVAVTYGAWSVAGQDENGTLSLVTLLPITRRNLVFQKAIALVLQVIPVVLLTYLLTVLGRSFQLDVDGAHLAAANLAGLLLGIDFGALALLVGVVARSRGLALGISAAVAAASYLVSSLTSTVHWLHPARFASLFYWAVGTNPIERGFALGPVLALFGTAVALIVVAAFAMQRHDVR